jgi:hypothetical protein
MVPVSVTCTSRSWAVWPPLPMVLWPVNCLLWAGPGCCSLVAHTLRDYFFFGGGERCIATRRLAKPYVPWPPHRLAARDRPYARCQSLITRGTIPARRGGWQQTAERFLRILQPPALPGGERGQADVNPPARPHHELCPASGWPTGRSFATKARRDEGKHQGHRGDCTSLALMLGSYAEVSCGPLTAPLIHRCKHWHGRPLTRMTPSS